MGGGSSEQGTPLEVKGEGSWFVGLGFRFRVWGFGMQGSGLLHSGTGFRVYG